VPYYRERILPRLINVTCGAKAGRPWRAEACAGLTGTVVEIGFGSGHNVPYYPSGVDEVVAVEPSDLAMGLASARVAASRVSVRRIGLDGQSVPLDDHCVDAALITFTLCTVPDPARVLSEVARIVRPGGAVHFLEHGLSPDARVAAWQRRLEPLQRRVADGCHLTRDARQLMSDAGLALASSRSGYMPGPKPWAYLTVGVARTPAAP